jgi:hypothetical protein
MTRDDTVVRETRPRGGMMYVARSRGMLSGLLLVLLGIWGAIIPFVGPYFSYAYTPDRAWAWTWGRFWLEVLPGAAAIVGGLMLIGTAHRAVGVFAGWLASAAGAWFVVGPVLSRLWDGPSGSAGTPIGGTTSQVLEQIGFFYGLGVVILFLAAQALGRFTVRSVRDVVPAETYRRDTVVAEPAAARPVTEPMAARPVAEPVAARPVAPPVVERERTAPVAETERERTAEFEGNRVATPPAETVEAPAVEHGTTPVSGEGATRVDTRRTP